MKRRSIKFLILLVISGGLISCTNTKIDKEAEYSLLRGVNLSQQGEYEEAMKEYFHSYNINPQNIILLKEIGYNYYQFGDYEKAEEYWLKAFKLNNKDEELLKNLATLYYKEKKYDKSLEIIKNSYNVNGEYYRKLKGLIAYKEGELEKGYYFLKDISMESYDVDTALIYIEILEKLNNREELLDFNRKIYPHLQDNSEYIVRYSRILSEKFNLNDESERVLIDYLIENGSDDEILLQLSKLYFKIGKENKGKDTLKLISDDRLLLDSDKLRKNLN